MISLTTAIHDEILRLFDVLQVDVDNEARNNNMHESVAGTYWQRETAGSNDGTANDSYMLLFRAWLSKSRKISS